MSDIVTTIEAKPGSTVREMILSIPPGTSCDLGCSEAELESVLAEADKTYINHRVSIVREWIWFDVALDKKELNAFKKAGILPSFLFSDNVEETAPGREFEWVRTTALRKFVHPCYFITRNTVYVLIGAGKRMTLSKKLAAKLF